MAEINPYLHFAGTCEQAFTFYQSVFGGELLISRFSEMPTDPSAPPVDGNLVMHVSLPLGEGQVLMGSDRPEAMGPTTAGNNVQVSIGPSSSEEGKRIFDALAEGGTVHMPYQETFWNADYGSLADKFGIEWMVNYDKSGEG